MGDQLGIGSIVEDGLHLYPEPFMLHMRGEAMFAASMCLGLLQN